MTPWVKLNYQGHADDVATMAHELGHAIHSMLAAHHSVFTFHSSLPLAETASTFGEMMLVDRLLAEEKDEAVRRDMLFRQVDDAYATIMRQAFFALFEKQAHEMVVQNASVDELAAAYMENLKEQFGEAVELSDEFKWEWVSIPHIYSHAVLRLCLCLRTTAGAFTLPAIQGRRRGLQAPLLENPGRRRLGSTCQDPGRGRHRHPLGGVLAGRI